MKPNLIHELRPRLKQRVIDLVSEAGVDVSDWGNYSGGARRAATNPKYCYEWAFVEPGHVIVLNLWYELLREERGSVFQEINLRQTARNLREVGASSVQIRRALSADDAIRISFEEDVPVRVIINDGIRRKEKTRGASKVRARVLDGSIWHIGAYDFRSGHAIIARGPRGNHYLDQFSVGPNATPPVAREMEVRVFERDPRVRTKVLRRAGGRCEHCGEPGFSMSNGAVYLETHHVVSLSEGGPDVETNVIALCPNHHRRAHHGLDSGELRSSFLRYLSLQTLRA